jgi:hypothetical protein
VRSDRGHGASDQLLLASIEDADAGQRPRLEARAGLQSATYLGHARLCDDRRAVSTCRLTAASAMDI